MSFPIYQVDSFTDRPFRGNPAGVCLLDREKPETWMQSVAAEMNLAETAFLFPSDGAFRLRWFTPVVEVDLCGHATLASAHVLWENGLATKSEETKFDTKSGRLTAAREGDRIRLDFPATPAEAAPLPAGTAEALGVSPVFTGRTRFDYLVEVGTAEEVRQARPNFAGLHGLEVRGVILTARSDREEFDFISRFFAPGAGIDEDPVTGSAHCCLGPFWGQRLNLLELKAWQASARGGALTVRLQGDRVQLLGHAVTVIRGELFGG